MLCEFTAMKVVMYAASDVSIAKLREDTKRCAKQLESQAAEFWKTWLESSTSVHCKQA